MQYSLTEFRSSFMHHTPSEFWMAERILVRYWASSPYRRKRIRIVERILKELPQLKKRWTISR